MGAKLRVSPLYVKVGVTAEFSLLNSLVLHYGRKPKKSGKKVLDGGQILENSLVVLNINFQDLTTGHHFFSGFFGFPSLIWV